MPYLKHPEDAMPWVGLYIAGASLTCTLAMAADAFVGIRQWKLWFPNKFFALNTVSISLIAIAMKLPVDLSADNFYEMYAKIISIFFLVVMLANFLPSLGLMEDKELLVNMIAWGILLITIIVNLSIQILAGQLFMGPVLFLLLLSPLLLVFSIALTVPASRGILEHKYKELHKLASYPQDIKFSSEELEHNVKNYWMMAETGNPQFSIACSEISSAFGVICSVFVFASLILLADILFYTGLPDYSSYDSDYKWSMNVIITVQLFGIVVGSIAPIFRCLTSISYFNLSTKLSKNHLNVFRVEKRWIKMFQVWKLSHVSSHIPGRHCKIIFNFLKNVVLNFCIALQVMAVVTCKITCLVPVLFLLLLSSCWYLCKLLVGIFEKEANVSHVNLRSEMEEYTAYVLQIEDDVKLSKRVQKNTLNSITRLLHASEKEKPKNLIKLLTKSKGFSGVLEFDNVKVRPLYSEEAQNSWSLVAVTLTAIAVALPNIAKDNVKGLLVSMTEGLEFVKHIEESLNVNEELVKARQASRRVGIEVAVYHTWLQSDFKKQARKGKSSKDILQWLGDRAAKLVQSKSNKDGSLDYSHEKVAANSMYRISQTILIHCTQQEEWPTDEEVFDWVSKIIADIFLACFTNLPRVITMKCHHDAIEKRQGSIRTAARILGKSKVILNILKERQLPNLDMDSMAYLDKWHALPKSQIPEDSPSLNMV